MKAQRSAEAGSVSASRTDQGNKKMLFVLLAAAVPLIWLGGDLLYFLLMKRRYARWEADIERDPDGVRRGCREYCVGQGDIAILLIHGFADAPTLYQRMAPALAEKGFTCRVMRLPHFAMPMDHYRRTDAAQWREAVRSELLELRRRHARVVVLAHSLGAAIAVDYLADDPTAADAVVLLAPLLAVCDRRSPLLSPRAWHAILDHTMIFMDRVGLPLPPNLRDLKALPLMKTDRFVPRIIYRELMHLIERNRDRAGTFRLPLLMALGEHDEVVDNRVAEHFYKACAARTKRLQYVAGAAHVLPMDFGWHSLTEDVVKFIHEVVEAP
jgi:alpha-beta hydrolase superfamily lysophospholipase